MTKIYVWPDATYLDASEYSEAEFSHKGDDYFVLDLQQLVNGRIALVYNGEDRLSELLQAELQLKATSSMFRNYRNTMREHLAGLHDEQSSTIAKLSAEQAAILANKEQEIKTILTARDQWVKELQGKLREATRLLANSEEVNEELENRIAVLSARRPSPAFQGDLAEENRRLKSQLAGATARIRKQYDAQAKLAKWKGRAESAEAERAKLKNTADIEDNLCQAAVADLQFQVAEAKAEVAKLKEASTLAKDREDNLRKELIAAENAERSQAEKTAELEIKVDELEETIDDMRRNTSAAIAMLQEVE